MPSGLYADTTLRDLLGLEVGDALVASGGGTDLPEYTTDDEGKVLGIVVDESGEEDVAELAWVKGVPQPADATGEGGTIPSVDSGKIIYVNDNGEYVLNVLNNYCPAPVSLHRKGLLKVNDSGNAYNFLDIYDYGNKLLGSCYGSWDWFTKPASIKIVKNSEYDPSDPDSVEYEIGSGTLDDLYECLSSGTVPCSAMYVDENYNIYVSTNINYDYSAMAYYFVFEKVTALTGAVRTLIFSVDADWVVTLTYDSGSNSGRN